VGGGPRGKRQRYISVASPEIGLDAYLTPEKTNANDSYQTEVNSYFQDQLTDFNDRKIDQINTHLETIRDALSQENIGSINLVYGGSVKKYTYINGLSDVDVLATIDGTTLANASPRQVLECFADKLRERLPNTEIKIGTLAVTVKFSDGHEIQILPAISTAAGKRISSENGTEWSNVVKPDKFADSLTKVNQSNSGKVIPVVKLYKAVNAGLPKEGQLSGYHIESLAINAFENYEGALTHKDMLSYLTQYASKAVLSPIKDKTGQSIHVDDYLGEAQSDDRKNASVILHRTAVRMKTADSEGSLEMWKKLVEG
jgi:hypothetical protein